MSLIKKLKKKNQHLKTIINDPNHSFYKYYHDSKKFNNISYKLNYSFLTIFLKVLNKFTKLKPQKEKKKKKNVYDAASESYNELLETYFDEYNELSDAKRKNIELKYDPNNLFLKTYNYDLWFKNEESTDR